MITTYLSVLLYEEPWILTSNASMHIWINRWSDKGTDYDSLFSWMDISSASPDVQTRKQTKHWLHNVSSIGGTRHIHFFGWVASSPARSAWLWWRVCIQGIPDRPMRGHVTKQTKWPTHVAAATWPPRRVARRVTAWQWRADWLRAARHHRAGAWLTKNSTKADVSVTTPATRARVKLGGYGVARGVLSIAPACWRHTHT